MFKLGYAEFCAFGTKLSILCVQKLHGDALHLSDLLTQADHSLIVYIGSSGYPIRKFVVGSN